MGELALDLLKSGANGRILAVFSKAIYLKTACGELLWLATHNIPMHRRGVQIQGPLPKVEAESAFFVEGRQLLLASHIVLDLGSAFAWEPPMRCTGQLLPFQDLPDRLQGVTRLFDVFPSPTGFGSLIPEIARHTVGNHFPTVSSEYSIVLEHARPALNEILLACIANDFPRILTTAEDLIGLGYGLTPSGDDFVGGLLYTSLKIQSVYTDFQGFSPSNVKLLLDFSRNHTNLISYVLLQDHAFGHASDTLHRFANAIIKDQYFERARDLGLELTQSGHSTGWDILAGVWMALFLAVCSIKTPISAVTVSASGSQ